MKARESRRHLRLTHAWHEGPGVETTASFGPKYRRDLSNICHSALAWETAQDQAAAKAGTNLQVFTNRSFKGGRVLSG
jgi:hypothetical protein